jgi:hypothetical protein
MIVYDLEQILRIVYGSTGFPFPKNLKDDSQGMISDKFPERKRIYRNDKSRFGKSLYGINSLGCPVFLPATLNGVVLDNPVVTISGKKTIVETPMVGFDGTIKEIINTGDYIVKIIVTAIRVDNLWPEDALHDLKKLFSLNEVLTLDCALTDVFLQAKDNVVITSFSTPDMMGIENAQIYEVNLISDTYFELEIK